MYLQQMKMFVRFYSVYFTMWKIILKVYFKNDNL